MKQEKCKVRIQDRTFLRGKGKPSLQRPTCELRTNSQSDLFMSSKLGLDGLSTFAYVCTRCPRRIAFRNDLQQRQLRTRIQTRQGLPTGAQVRLPNESHQVIRPKQTIRDEERAEIRGSYSAREDGYTEKRDPRTELRYGFNETQVGYNEHRKDHTERRVGDIGRQDSYTKTRDGSPEELPTPLGKDMSPALNPSHLTAHLQTYPPTPQQLKYATHFFSRHPPAFLFGTSHFHRFPPSPAPEVAFVGRSNVGKSSLLNALMNRSTSRLAETSSKPGKTKTLNAYGIAGDIRASALPGGLNIRPRLTQEQKERKRTREGEDSDRRMGKGASRIG